MEYSGARSADDHDRPVADPVPQRVTGSWARAKADERQVLLEIFHTDPTLTADRPGHPVHRSLTVSDH
jgi:hypothetical protein